MQPVVHPVIVQSPLPPQLTVQLPPGQASVMSPAELPLAEQWPSAQVNEQSPLPLQSKMHPVVGHDNEQSDEVTQEHVVPLEQLVEFVCCVVALTEQAAVAATTKVTVMARRRTGRRVSMPTWSQVLITPRAGPRCPRHPSSPQAATRSTSCIVRAACMKTHCTDKGLP